MPVGSADISMDGVASELGYSVAIPNNRMATSLFYSSQKAYDPRGGSFHNLAMALPALSSNFATAIELPYSIGINMPLGNWAEYFHDANAKIHVIIENSSRRDVNCTIFISDNTTFAGAVIVFSGAVPANNAGDINNVFDTGVAAYSTYNTTGYWLLGEFQMVPSGVPTFMTVNAFDSDNVGAGTARYNYTVTGSPGGPWNLDTLTGGAPFSGVLVSGVRTLPFPDDGISWNKRTTIFINIYD